MHIECHNIRFNSQVRNKPFDQSGSALNSPDITPEFVRICRDLVKAHFCRQNICSHSGDPRLDRRELCNRLVSVHLFFRVFLRQLIGALHGSRKYCGKSKLSICGRSDEDIKSLAMLSKYVLLGGLYLIKEDIVNIAAPQGNLLPRCRQRISLAELIYDKCRALPCLLFFREYYDRSIVGGVGNKTLCPGDVVFVSLLAGDGSKLLGIRTCPRLCKCKRSALRTVYTRHHILLQLFLICIEVESVQRQIADSQQCSRRGGYSADFLENDGCLQITGPHAAVLLRIGHSNQSHIRHDSIEILRKLFCIFNFLYPGTYKLLCIFPRN